MLRQIAAAALVGGMLSVFASPILYRGWKHRARYTRIRDTPIASPGAVDDGNPVLLRAVARADGERVTAPVSEGDVLLAAWDVRRWVNRRFSGHRYWLPEARGVEVAAVSLNADGRTVRMPRMSRAETVDRSSGFVDLPGTATGIDLPDIDVEVDAFETDVELSPGDDRPARLRRLSDRFDLDSQPQRRELIPFTRAHGTRHVRESTVTDGREVTVRAVLCPPAGTGDELRLEAPPDGPLLVSPLAPTALQRRYRVAYWKRFHLFVAVIVVASLAVALL